MWRGLIFSCIACVLCGCVTVPNEVNYATANAMRYSGLAADAKKRDAELAAAIQAVSHSAEHRHMQRILADLPADMDGCVVIEMAQAEGDGLAMPAVLGMFVSGNSLGFLSNFEFDEDGMSAPLGGEWRAATWGAEEDAQSLLPSDPAELLPGEGVAETRPADGAVVIVTLVNRQRAVSVAIWDTMAQLAPEQRMVRYMPGELRKRLHGRGLQAVAAASSWRSADPCLD